MCPVFHFIKGGIIVNQVKKETIIRTAVLAIALINQGLTLSGLNPLPYENEQVENFVAGVFTVSASLWTWWKNNSFTSNAIKADEYKE